jgi:hypothetical protein
MINALKGNLKFKFIIYNSGTGRCSSGVECFLGKEEVTGSIPVIGSSLEFEH